MCIGALSCRRIIECTFVSSPFGTGEVDDVEEAFLRFTKLVLLNNFDSKNVMTSAGVSILTIVFEHSILLREFDE